MRRSTLFPCLVALAALLPLQAEAARFRSGPRGLSKPKSSSAVIIVPAVGRATPTQAAASATPEKVPFPPRQDSAAEPVPIRLSNADEVKRPWCRTEAVVGGFCMMN
jgi:hypothetical protein